MLLQYQCNKDHITRLNATHFSAIQFSSRNEFKATYWNAVSRRPCYNHPDDLIVIVHLCSFEKAASSAVVEPSATFCLCAQSLGDGDQGDFVEDYGFDRDHYVNDFGHYVDYHGDYVEISAYILGN